MTAPDVAVVDCGMGNLHSVMKAVERLAPSAQAVLTSDPDTVARAAKVILPGDGAFGPCMEEIRRRGLREALSQAAVERPFFGICVGMQVLFDSSEESGGADGLGLLPGRILRFPADGPKVPHIGWNRVWRGEPHPCLEGVPDGCRFYFAHSYYAPVIEGLVGAAEYPFRFSAIVAKGRLLATQFHPEKSHKHGMRLLANFLASP